MSSAARTSPCLDWRQSQKVAIDQSPLAVKLVDDRIAGGRGLWGGATVPVGPRRNRFDGEKGDVCARCETHFPFRIMDDDHFLPRSLGGTDHPENLQLLRPGRSRGKDGKVMAESRASQ